MCPDWSLVDFYIDEGATAPNMETAPEWSRLLQDALDGKVDLIITQKVSNVSKKDYEIAFVARILAALDKPVGIYFVSEDIFTLASYYRSSPLLLFVQCLYHVQHKSFFVGRQFCPPFKDLF